VFGPREAVTAAGNGAGGMKFRPCVSRTATFLPSYLVIFDNAPAYDVANARLGSVRGSIQGAIHTALIAEPDWSGTGARPVLVP
jgi:hypothetical protein